MRDSGRRRASLNVCADPAHYGYNERTSLTYHPTVSSTVGDDPPTPEPIGHVLADGDPDTSVWDLMTWPQRRPTYAEICWVAGLFEGEGSFGDGRIEICQHDREILDTVKRLVGGRVGGPYRQRDRTTGRERADYRWYATGPRGRGVARTLFQLLSTRRKAQARMFLRISRQQDPPALDPDDPARLLWDWAPDGECE